MLPNYPSSQLSLGHYILFSNSRLGSGAFGDVYRGQNIINNTKIAIKCENKNTLMLKDKGIQVFIGHDAIYKVVIVKSEELD